MSIAAKVRLAKPPRKISTGMGRPFVVAIQCVNTRNNLSVPRDIKKIRINLKVRHRRHSAASIIEDLLALQWHGKDDAQGVKLSVVIDIDLSVQLAGKGKDQL